MKNVIANIGNLWITLIEGINKAGFTHFLARRRIKHTSLISLSFSKIKSLKSPVLSS